VRDQTRPTRVTAVVAQSPDDPDQVSTAR
jgi:hypothetical protein